MNSSKKIKKINQLKRKIVCLTAYSKPIAKILDKYWVGSKTREADFSLFLRKIFPFFWRGKKPFRCGTISSQARRVVRNQVYPNSTKTKTIQQPLS